MTSTEPAVLSVLDAYLRSEGIGWRATCQALVGPSACGNVTTHVRRVSYVSKHAGVGDLPVWWWTSVCPAHTTGPLDDQA